MGVSSNGGFLKWGMGFSIINHPFWGTPILGNHQMEHSLVTVAFNANIVFVAWASMLDDDNQGMSI